MNKSKVMMCTSRTDGGRMNVVLNGKLLEEVEGFEYIGLHVDVDGGIDGEVSLE